MSQDMRMFMKRLCDISATSCPPDFVLAGVPFIESKNHSIQIVCGRRSMDDFYRKRRVSQQRYPWNRSSTCTAWSSTGPKEVLKYLAVGSSPNVRWIVQNIILGSKIRTAPTKMPLFDFVYVLHVAK